MWLDAAALLAVAFVTIQAAAAHNDFSGNVVPHFPLDSNVTNVLDYGIKGDGHTDNAAALSKLFNASTRSTFFYFPEGTYLLSEPIKAWSRDKCIADFIIIAGAGEGRTTIRLKDSIPSAQDPSSGLVAVLQLGCSPAQNFHDGIQDLTISTGNGNPGAVGLRFNANNNGWIRRVSIRSEDGQSAIGLDQAFSDQIGPMITTDLTISGFDIGLAISHSVDSLTFERVTVLYPRMAGVFANHQVATLRRLTVQGNPSLGGLIAPRAASAVTLIDSEFICSGKTPGGAASACDAPAILLNTNLTLDASFWQPAGSEIQRDENDPSSEKADVLEGIHRSGISAARQLYQLPTCQIQSLGCWAVTSPNSIYQCFADCPKGGKLTIEKCLGCCGGQGYPYFALGDGCACHCFDDWATARNETGATDVPPSECDVPCGGDKKETCGGKGKLQIMSPDFEPCFRNGTLDPSNVQTVVFARNISFSGFPVAVANVTGTPGNFTTTVLEGEISLLKEWTSSPPVVLIPDARGNTSMALEVHETPTFFETDGSKWANAAASCQATFEHPAYKSNSTHDCSASFQAALDSGATTVYWPQPGPVPPGKGSGAPVYWLAHDVHVPRTVRKIVGFCSVLGALIGNGSVVIDEGDESDAPLIFERLASPIGGSKEPLNYWHKSKRTVAFTDYSGLSNDGVHHPEWNMTINTGGYNNGTLPDWVPGTVFLDDVVGGVFRFHKQKVYARQLNTENAELDVVNDGGQLWVLGYKTEKGEGGLIHTVNGGKTEILGSFSYDTEHTPIETPAFYADNTSSLSATFQVISEMHRPVSLGFVNMVVQGSGDSNYTLTRDSEAAGYVPRDGGQGAVALYAGTRA